MGDKSPTEIEIEHLKLKDEDLEKRMAGLNAKLDKLIIRATAAACSFTMAGGLLAIDIILRLRG